MNIFEKCPILENGDYIIRLISKEDKEDLFWVYSDLNALPFFNSDNCNGDCFYYETKRIMSDVVDFWMEAYQKGWFVRMTIIEKKSRRAIGTIELCKRVSTDSFNDYCILRIDVGSEYERRDVLLPILNLVTPCIREALGTEHIITKGPIYAVERKKALSEAGYQKLDKYLIASNGYAYDSYYER